MYIRCTLRGHNTATDLQVLEVAQFNFARCGPGFRLKLKSLDGAIEGHFRARDLKDIQDITQAVICTNDGVPIVETFLSTPTLSTSSDLDISTASLQRLLELPSTASIDRANQSANQEVIDLVSPDKDSGPSKVLQFDNC